jgi:MutS domain V
MVFVKVTDEREELSAELRNPVLGIYTNKLQDIQQGVGFAERERVRALIIGAGFVLLMIVAMASSLLTHSYPLITATIPFVGVAFALRLYWSAGQQWAQLSQQREFYENGVSRLNGTWQGQGETGSELARDNHLYQWDLNVLGRGSLFELLCTTRSKVGTERLASYLLDPVLVDETRERQEAVKELRNLPELREEMIQLRGERLKECSGHVLQEWDEMAVLNVPRIVSIFLAVSSCATALWGLAVLVKIIAWTQFMPLFILLLIVQLGIAAILLTRTRPQIRKLRLLSNSFTVLHQGLELMERQHFHSPKLRSLVDRVCAKRASLQVGRLERLIRAFDQREKEFFYFLSVILVVGTQLVLAIDRWRGRYRQDLKDWLAAWAEFDALCALALYAFEHPECVFPELVDEAPTFEAKGLRHPLLAKEVCVGNDFFLNEASRFYLISGSNMAGKSTLLRAVGLNAVLAAAGGPVCARWTRISDLTMCASISINDSLLDGRSKFMAEVERLRETIRCSNETPVLFLIDEIFSGTNSEDRRTAAEMVVATLIEGGAVGAVSTHDLALTEVVSSGVRGGVLAYMASENADDPLDFDYRLKAGVSRRPNGMAIVKMMGIGG